MGPGNEIEIILVLRQKINPCAVQAQTQNKEHRTQNTKHQYKNKQTNKQHSYYGVGYSLLRCDKGKRLARDAVCLECLYCS